VTLDGVRSADGFTTVDPKQTDPPPVSDRAARNEELATAYNADHGLSGGIGKSLLKRIARAEERFPTGSASGARAAAATPHAWRGGQYAVDRLRLASCICIAASLALPTAMRRQADVAVGRPQLLQLPRCRWKK